MRKNLFFLLISVFTLTAFAQTNTEQLSHVKKIRHTTFPLNDEMTEWETRLDDQNIIHSFYDINGNKILQRTRTYNAAKSTSYISYKYNDKNQLIEEIDGSTKYLYNYNNDGNVEKREKYGSTGTVSETIAYEYVDGRLTKEIVYNSSGNVSTTYNYVYDNGLLVNREKYNSSNQMSGNIEYVYNNKNQLIVECDSTIRTSNGLVSSAKRYTYEYDANDRLYSKTYESANVTSYEITGWTGKEMYIYIYEGTSNKKIREELHTYSTTKAKYEIYEHDEYTYSSKYGSEFIPGNVSFTQGEKVTSIIMSVNEPTNKTGLSGYRVIADNKLLDTLYTSTSFEIEDQLRGNHTYRVMAVYDTIPSTVSNELLHMVDINLPAPNNATIITQEYSSQWQVSFSFDAPNVPEGVNLTGYRYKVIGGNGGASGTSNADNNKVSFKLYADTKNNDNNLCKVELYAVYAEGESDPYIFDIDLRDTENQITIKWQNYLSESVDASGAALGNNHYYYTSTYSGEALASKVEYDAENNPKYRHTTANGIDYIDVWDAETMQWGKYSKKEKSKEDGTSWENWYDCVTTSVFDAETNEYEPTEVVKAYSYYNASYKIILGNTSTYKINSGEETLVKYVTHYTSDDKALSVDTVYAADKVTITGLVRYNYNADQVLSSKENLKYENGAYAATDKTVYDYNAETGLISSEKQYQIDGNAETLSATTTYYASKEYGSIKAPASATFDGVVLSWENPANKYMNPDAYRIFVNNIPYADVEEGNEIEITDIPSGDYKFTVMSLYNGMESNYVTSTEGTFVNMATFIPILITPDVYEEEKGNKVESLKEVVITFPTAVASLAEGVKAAFNTVSGSVGDVKAAISSDSKSVVITLPEALANGTYFLEIPKGMIVAQNGTYNPALNYTFALQLPLTYDLPTPEITPASDKEISVADGLETFTLSFDSEVCALESAIGATGFVYLVESGNSNRTEGVIRANSDANTWTITLNEKVDKIGEYVLVIKKAIFGDATAAASIEDGNFISGKVNAELTFKYTISNMAVENIEDEVMIRVINRNIIAPESAKVYCIEGYEVGKENLVPGIYMVVYNNKVTRVQVR